MHGHIREKETGSVLVMDPQAQLVATLVGKDEIALDRQVLRIVRVDDGELATPELCLQKYSRLVSFLPTFKRSE